MVRSKLLTKILRCACACLFAVTASLHIRHFEANSHGKGTIQVIPPTQSEKMFLVPYLKGQGFNNQLWEYRTAAIIARATGRALCLEPFHRFYLSQDGRAFIPFDEIFDTESLKGYVDVEAGGGNCAKLCANKLHSHVELTTKPSPARSVLRIADWRPGSLKNFRGSTNFKQIPTPLQLNINPDRGGVAFKTHEEIRNGLHIIKNDTCVSVSGPLLNISAESELWTDKLVISKQLMGVKDRIRSHFFSNSRYLAIHWRVEETRCAETGRGIGYGRSRKTSKAERGKKDSSSIIVRRSDHSAELCFFAIRNRTKLWLRLVSKEAIVRWIHRIKFEHNLENVYLATDMQDEILLRWVKSKTGAISRSDIYAILKHGQTSLENDVVSVLEQEICTEAEIFAGTQMSSWTLRVNEKRARGRNQIFNADMLNMGKRPDESNTTFYMDVEACECEW